ASALPEGSLTIFNFSDSLQGVPTSLLVISFVTAAFPALSELWAKSDADAFRRLFAKTLSELLIWTVPAALILFAFREAVVALTLAYGDFDVLSQARTVTAFGIFILALPLQGLRFLLLRSFFASGDTRTPLLSYLGSMPVVILSASRLGLSFGVSGLAFAIVLGTVIDTCVLSIIFQRRFRDLYLREIGRVFGKSLVLGFLAALGGWLTFQGLGFFIREKSLSLLFFRTLIALLPVGIVLFIGILMYRIFDLRVFGEEDSIKPNESRKH
ncbi:MAG: oligosaccharide flippase family protein, partial [Parcubacteria group bacterium]|nr:oligosaccharide flippase family protein [Parcubacteria group bacterium]